MKFVPIVFLALLLVSAAPAPTPPALPPATLPIVHHAAAAHQPNPTPAVTIAGSVEGQHRLGYRVPLGMYTAYGATIGEATINVQALSAQIRAQAAPPGGAP